MSASDVQMIFLPGLGATQDLFVEQKKLFPDALFPEWIASQKDESLSSYAERFAQELASRPTRPVENWVLIGFSFGSQVALELSKHLPTKAIVILSGFRSSDEIPSRFHLQTRLGLLFPDRFIQWILSQFLASYFCKKERLEEEYAQLIFRMAEQVDLDFFRWAALAARKWSWDCSQSDSLEIIQVHGEKDFVIPLRYLVSPDLVLKDASHLIQFTNAKEVNKIISDVL